MNSPSVFTVADRDRLRGCLLQMAASDPRIVAGAAVGSLALAEGDRWSDLDLTFAVAGSLSLTDVLEDWTRTLAAPWFADLEIPPGASQ
jgi:hypothetical protein